MLDDERRMVSAACGGNILNKTAQGAFDLFIELAKGSRQFCRRNLSSKQVNLAQDTFNASLQTEVRELKAMMRNMMVKGMTSPPVLCGICTDGHPTDTCPIMQEPSSLKQVSALDGYNNRPRFDPYSNTYNRGWAVHPRWNNQNFQGQAP